MYVPEDCKSKRRMDLEDESLEIVWVELRLSKKLFLVGNMYRPPNGVATILDKLEDMLERPASENKRVILILTRSLMTTGLFTKKSNISSTIHLDSMRECFSLRPKRMRFCCLLTSGFRDTIPLDLDILEFFSLELGSAVESIPGLMFCI